MKSDPQRCCTNPYPDFVSCVGCFNVVLFGTHFVNQFSNFGAKFLNVDKAEGLLGNLALDTTVQECLCQFSFDTIVVRPLFFYFKECLVLCKVCERGTPAKLG